MRVLIALSFVREDADFKLLETEVHTIPCANKHLTYTSILFCKTTLSNL